MSFVSLVFPSLALLFVLIITNSSARNFCIFVFANLCCLFSESLVLFRLMCLGERREGW